MTIDPRRAAEERRTKIYGLLDPRTLELRYVGKTVKPLRARQRGHVFDAKKQRNYRERWVWSLLKQGLEPIIEEFEEVSGDGSAAEITHIGIARALGCRLVNGTDGGDGTLGSTKSPETRAKIGAANKKQRGAKRSPEMRARLSESLKGNKYNLGRRLSDEHKRRVGDAFRGKKLSSDHVAKMKEARARQARPTPEQNAQNSARQKGTKLSAERRAQISKYMADPKVGAKISRTKRAAHFFRVLVRSVCDRS